MRLDDLDFDLPSRLIAQYPAARRDESRLLVVPRAGGTLRHALFRDLVDLLQPEDVLVLNRSRVVPVRFFGHKERTGGRAELLLLRRTGTAAGVWLAMARPLKGLVPGDAIRLDRGDVRFEVVERRGDRVLVRLPGGWESDPGVRDPAGLAALLPLAEAAGDLPLPPYIRRPVEPGDRERYQTVFACDPGSLAAPTAGLHFTEELLMQVRGLGVGVVTTLLHVGPGTFEPIRASDPCAHRLEAEYYRLGRDEVDEIERRRRLGGRVIAVGTTSVRVLESCWRDDRLWPGEGWTDLLIHPPHRFGSVDGLVTNFHLPRSSLLLLVCAFAGRRRLLAAYGEAVAAGYRFYSYGDAMFIC